MRLGEKLLLQSRIPGRGRPSEKKEKNEEKKKNKVGCEALTNNVRLFLSFDFFSVSGIEQLVHHET